MLFCRYCGTALKKTSAICPNCGQDNDPEAIAGREKKGLSKKQLLSIIAVVLAVAVLIPAVFYGVKGVKHLLKPNDLYYKDNYSLSEFDMAKEKDVVVATMGDHKVTNGVLQVFYWARVYEFMNAVGSYSSYYGIDFAKPFNEQIYDEKTGKTWQQMFLEQAITDWKNYTLMCDDAKANNYKLEAANQEKLDKLYETLEEEAKEKKLETVEEYLDAYICPDCTYEEYKTYYELYFTANVYFSDVAQNWEVTDAELEAYFTEHADELKSTYKVTKESGKLYAVRHILINVEGGSKDDKGQTVYSDEEWDTCRKEAQAILDEYLAGDKTEESFAALAKEKSEDGGSKSNGGLYSDLSESTSFVEPFKKWYLDESRKPGDTGLVQSVYGYHVMYFSSGEEGWILYSRMGVQDEKTNAKLEELTKDAPLDVNYKKISVVLVAFN